MWCSADTLNDLLPLEEEVKEPLCLLTDDDDGSEDGGSLLAEVPLLLIDADGS